MTSIGYVIQSGEDIPDDVYRGHCLTFAALRALGDVTEVTE